jgi:hypothetical protein
MVAADAAKKAAAAAPASKKAGNNKDQPPHPDDDLSDEDLELKRELEQLVERVAAGTAARDYGSVLSSAKQLCDKIRTATASMTSVPKPLKFLRPHAQMLKARWADLPAGAAGAQDARRALADVVSVLASTGAPRGAPGGAARAARLRECLRFRVAGTRDDVGSWGHEYLRHLAGEIAAEYGALRERDEEDEAAAAGGGGSKKVGGTAAAADAAAAEAEAAALDEADLDRAEQGGADGGDKPAAADGRKPGDAAAADDKKKKAAAAPKASEGGGGDAAADGDKDGDKKKGDAAEPERKKLTLEERMAWLAEQRAIRAALPPVQMADIMALVEQVR